MTFLGLPDNCETVNGYDFMAWVNKYLQPEKLGISAKELWAMRCRVLEEQVTQKDFARGSKPRTILFAWGRYSILDGLQLPSSSRWHRIMTIHADELYKALIRGGEEFSVTFINESANAYIVGRRLNQVFGPPKM